MNSGLEYSYFLGFLLGEYVFISDRIYLQCVRCDDAVKVKLTQSDIILN